MTARRPERDYATLSEKAQVLAAQTEGRPELLRKLVDLLWEGLEGKGVDWLGFYLVAATGNAMTLEACRPKPACSPIGLHGVCGRSFRERRSIVVDDCHALGADHIVCDPANRSEVVVPLLGPNGECAAVLDLDSHDLAGFAEEDARGLEDVLRAAGLTE